MPTLLSYDFDEDAPEISENASNLMLSNHSYGDIAGWDRMTGPWIWYGLPGDSEDYLFGFYDERAQEFDRIAFEAPYYLIVEAAGNSHGDPGPSVGEDYYGYKSRTDSTIVFKGPRPEGISSNDGYDVIPTTGNAKNILTVGAVYPVYNDPAATNDINIAPFSGWGPTDDGRVKPDIVGMGVGVYSTNASGDYETQSGTSMSTPNVTGSLLLLQEYYAQKHHDSLMRSATLKALACHTAVDGGRPGPDYIYGWGLLDMRKAANTITNNGISAFINEANLQQGQSKIYTITATGSGPVAATIAWTDPAGTPPESGIINDRTPKLVNDLDMQLAGSGGTFHPWILDPDNPGADAKKGDNIRDNIEQVYIPDAVAGQQYTIRITHKDVLKNGAQDYSIILTGAKITGSMLSNINNVPAVFPVPAYDKLTVLFNQKTTGMLKLSLFSINGQRVYSWENNVPAGNFNKQIDAAALANGGYVLQLVSGGETFVRKVVVAKVNLTQPSTEGGLK